MHQRTHRGLAVAFILAVAAAPFVAAPTAASAQQTAPSASSMTINQCRHTFSNASDRCEPGDKHYIQQRTSFGFIRRCDKDGRLGQIDRYDPDYDYSTFYQSSPCP